MDLTGASFGPTGRTVDSVDVVAGGALVFSGTLTVSGQTRLEESGSAAPATLRGASPGAELIAAGGAYFDDYYQELDQLSLVIPAGATAEASASDLASSMGRASTTRGRSTSRRRTSRTTARRR